MAACYRTRRSLPRPECAGLYRPLARSANRGHAACLRLCPYLDIPVEPNRSCRFCTWQDREQVTSRRIGLSFSGTGFLIDKESWIDGLVELDADLVNLRPDMTAAAYSPGDMLVLLVSVDQANLARCADLDGIRMQEGDTAGAYVSAGDNERGLLVTVKQRNAYTSHSVPITRVPAPGSQQPVQSIMRFAVVIQLVEDLIDVCGVEFASYTNGLLQGTYHRVPLSPPAMALDWYIGCSAR